MVVPAFEQQPDRFAEEFGDIAALLLGQSLRPPQVQTMEPKGAHFDRIAFQLPLPLVGLGLRDPVGERKASWYSSIRTAAR